MALFLAGAAIGAVALLGGFARSEAATTRFAATLPMQTVDSDLFAITPLCAWTAGLRPGQPASAAGPQRYLMLRATVVSQARDWVAIPAYLDRDVVWLPGGAAEPVRLERSQRADDATLGLTLGPGLPVVVDLVWNLPPGTSAPTQATWGVYARHHVEKTWASGEEMWVQADPAGRFTLPVGAACAGSTR